MTTSVRFCLSYDPLKWDFIAFKMNVILIRKLIVDMNVVNDVTCMRQSVMTRVVIRFYDMTYDITATSYDNWIYSIPSSEFNAYLKQIKSNCLQWKNIVFFHWWRIQFISFHCSKQRLFQQFRAYFLPEKIWNALFLIDNMLRTVAGQIKQMTSPLTSLLNLRNAYLHATLVRRQLQAAFLNRTFLLSSH